MPPFSVDLTVEIAKLSHPWSPIEIARVNDHVVRLARFEGEYPGGFHTHVFDELFYVTRGAITIQRRGLEDLVLREGEMGVVPKGAEH